MNGSTEERTREFLSAEEMAQELVVKLSSLDEAAAKYSSSADILSQSAEATHNLIDVVRELGHKAAEALEVVASVGGPTIIERLESLEASSGNSSNQVRKLIYWVIGLAGAAVFLASVSVVVAVLK
jgi:hypothetical protein